MATAHARTQSPPRAVEPRRQVYLKLLGLPSADLPTLLHRLERGLPFSAVEQFQRHTALSMRDLASLIGVPERTLARRRDVGRLQPDEADRLLRASRLFGQILALFEDDAEAARAWFVKPQRAWDGATPLQIARTELGAREVEHLIGRLEHGIPS